MLRSLSSPTRDDPCPPAKKQVIDVGCGIGGPYRNISRFTGWDITGVCAMLLMSFTCAYHTKSCHSPHPYCNMSARWGERNLRTNTRLHTLSHTRTFIHAHNFICTYTYTLARTFTHKHTHRHIFSFTHSHSHSHAHNHFDIFTASRATRQTRKHAARRFRTAHTMTHTRAYRRPPQVTLNEYQVKRANHLCKINGLDKQARSVQGDFMKLTSIFPKVNKFVRGYDT